MSFKEVFSVTPKAYCIGLGKDTELEVTDLDLDEEDEEDV